MALINCKECDTEFSTLADKCPRCGAPTSYSTGVEKLPSVREETEIIPSQDNEQSQQPARYEQTNVHHHHNTAVTPPVAPQPQINIHTHAPPPAPQIRYISTLLFLGVIFFPLIFYWFLFRKGHTVFARVAGGIWLVICLLATNAMFSNINGSASTHPTSQQENVSSVPALEVDAMQLYNDYQRNEVSADEKYKGKTLLVTGVVGGINKDYADKAYIKLSTDNMFMSVMARLQAGEVSRASQLSKGQWVVVECVGHGMVAGSPMLSKCVITDNQQSKKEPDPVIEAEIPKTETIEPDQTVTTEQEDVAATESTTTEDQQADIDLDSSDNHGDMIASE